MHLLNVPKYRDENYEGDAKEYEHVIGATLRDLNIARSRMLESVKKDWSLRKLKLEKKRSIYQVPSVLQPLPTLVDEAIVLPIVQAQAAKSRRKRRVIKKNSTSLRASMVKNEYGLSQRDSN